MKPFRRSWEAQGLSDFRCNWSLAFLAIRGVDAALEGYGDGAQRGPPSDHPWCPPGARGIE